jgi:hypothetical protein
MLPPSPDERLWPVTKVFVSSTVISVFFASIFLPLCSLFFEFFRLLFIAFPHARPRFYQADRGTCSSATLSPKPACA